MKIGVLTGGGDTQALNATLYGVLKGARRYNYEVIGFRYGWKGVLEKDYIKLREVDPRKGGTILKTSRKKLEGEEIKTAARNIEELVDAFVAVGGDDTLSVGKELSSMLEIPFCFVTKTIDNDVGINMPSGSADFSKMINYFTPGFATAAAKIVNYTAQIRTTAYSHDRIIFLEAMGREPGWLALASHLGKPDFIIVPEVGLDYKDFLGKLMERYKERGNALVVVAEGARYKGCSSPISEDKTLVDSFGHKKLGGVAESLAERVRNDTGVKDCRHVNPNYLYRSGRPRKIDRKYAIKLGKLAVKTVDKGLSNMVAVLERRKNKLYAVARPVEEVIDLDADGRIIPRTLNLGFYDSERYCITSLGREYYRVIFGR